MAREPTNPETNWWIERKTSSLTQNSSSSLRFIPNSPKEMISRNAVRHAWTMENVLIFPNCVAYLSNKIICCSRHWYQSTGNANDQIQYIFCISIINDILPLFFQFVFLFPLPSARAQDSSSVNHVFTKTTFNLSAYIPCKSSAYINCTQGLLSDEYAHDFTVQYMNLPHP